MNSLFRFPAAVRSDPSIDAWLRNQAPGLRELAKTWFQRIRECGRDIREIMHDGYPTACVEDAAFAYVGVFRTHITVGFFRGAELDDLCGLLEGTGKHMRHVKIKPGTDLDRAAVVELIGSAYTDMKKRLFLVRQDETHSSSSPTRSTASGRTPPNKPLQGTALARRR